MCVGTKRGRADMNTAYTTHRKFTLHIFFVPLLENVAGLALRFFIAKVGLVV